MALHDIAQWASVFYQGIYLADRVSTMAHRPRGVPAAPQGRQMTSPAARPDFRGGAHRVIHRAHRLLDLLGLDDD